MDIGLEDKIDRFQEEFDLYIKYLIEYIDAKNCDNHKFKMGHPELFKSSIRIQAKYYALPKNLKERLFKLGFEIFLQCDNPVDFYNFRNFIYDENLIYAIGSLSERVDSELKFAKELLNENAWEEYDSVIERNYDFFMTRPTFRIIDYCRKKFIKEKEEASLEYRCENCKRKNEYIESVEKELEKVTVQSDKTFFEDTIKFIKKGNEIVSEAGSLFGKIGKGVALVNAVLRKIPK